MDKAFQALMDLRDSFEFRTEVDKLPREEKIKVYEEAEQLPLEHGMSVFYTTVQYAEGFPEPKDKHLVLVEFFNGALFGLALAKSEELQAEAQRIAKELWNAEERVDQAIARAKANTSTTIH